MTLYIRHMVSLRCKMLVKDELKKLGFHSFTVELGEAVINEDISPEKYKQIKQALEASGFGIVEDKKRILIERIKSAIISIVHHSDEPLIQNLSTHLSTTLGYDYTYMSNLFSDQLGITVEKFYISHKIERAKELLVYGELSLTDIAFTLNYSSVGHLSNQFKKVTGITPSSFKKQKNKNRSALEDL